MTDKEREKQEKFLEIHLPYRMKHLDGFIWVGSGCCYTKKRGHFFTFPNGISINERGFNLTKNSILEIGLINCRIIAQFLGIQLTGYRNIKNKKELKTATISYKEVVEPDNFVISRIERSGKEKLAPVIEDDIAELENNGLSGLTDSLKFTIWAASKASAHFTDSESALTCKTSPLVVMSAKALLRLVEEKVYKQLDVDVPIYKVWTGS